MQLVLLEPFPDNRLAVILTRHQRGPIQVANTRNFGRIRRKAVKGSANRTLPTATQAGYELIVVNDQVYHTGVNPPRRRQLSQNRSLIQRTRISVENETIAAIRLLNSFFHQSIHQFVRNQPPGLHAAFNIAANRILRFNMLTKHIAGRNMRPFQALFP